MMIILQVPANMTAHDLITEIHKTHKRIPRIDGYALHEVVCSGELERPLRDEERVRAHIHHVIL